jgi:hypothetical protein
MENFEVIIGRNATLRLSMGTARLLYRGILSLTACGMRSELPERVRTFLERRRAMLGCESGPVDLQRLLSGELDGHGQRSLANIVRHIAVNAAAIDGSELGLNPSVRIRFVAALIEVYRLLCANLPVDLTLPPPVGIAMSRNDWRLIEVERLRIRSESDGALREARDFPEPEPTLVDRKRRNEILHRQISVFAG